MSDRPVPPTTSSTTSSVPANATPPAHGDPAPEPLASTVVVDTSSLLNDPGLLDELSHHQLVVPLAVLLELDAHKRRDDEVGQAARESIRRLDRARTRGDLTKGVASPAGGSLRVLRTAESMPSGLDAGVPDHCIAAVAHQLRTDGEQVSLLTDDTALRVLASVVGLSARSHTPLADPDRPSAHPTGWTHLEVTDRDVDELWSGTLAGDRLAALCEAVPHPNGYALLETATRTVRARRRGDRLQAIGDLPPACGLAPRDHVQAFALDALADPAVPLVALTGKAGSGKTLLAVATGLAMLARGEVEHVTVLRPITAVDNQDMGFLPGDVDDKFAPFTGAVADVLSAVPKLPPGIRDRNPVRDLIDAGKLTCAPITHLRGRTLANTYVVLDEAQNLSIRGVRTVATRIGPSSQLAVVGDPAQIDDPYLTPTSNGLAQLLRAFTGQRLFAHLHLASVQRSDLAAVAAELL